MLLELTVDETRYLGHALGWVLDGPFARTERPKLSLSELLLRKLFEAVIPPWHSLAESHGDDWEKIRRAKITHNLDTCQVQDLVKCLKSVCDELGHSPVELRVVFDCDKPSLEALREKLEAQCPNSANFTTKGPS